MSLQHVFISQFRNCKYAISISKQLVNKQTTRHNPILLYWQALIYRILHRLPIGGKMVTWGTDLYSLSLVKNYINPSQG